MKTRLIKKLDKDVALVGTFNDSMVIEKDYEVLMTIGLQSGTVPVVTKKFNFDNGLPITKRMWAGDWIAEVYISVDLRRFFCVKNQITGKIAFRGDLGGL